MREIISLIAAILYRLPEYSDPSIVTDLATRAFDAGVVEGSKTSIVPAGTGLAAVLNHLSRGEKLLAIKAYRTATGQGLMEGKAFIEAVHLLINIGGF